jgi:glutathione-regulated potassium-efflux system ancillary protein KefC
MTEVWALASLWIGLALISTFISVKLGIATALSEILVGIVAQGIIVAYFGGFSLGASESWISFLAGSGAIVLTFLAGAELDPVVFRAKWKEVSLIGLVAFFVPFFGCAAAAYYILGWSLMASWLCGVALSTTSVAVVYAVMLELGLNRTEYGKVVLGACFINDLGTVIALGLLFSPFTIKSMIFIGVSILVFIFLPRISRYFFEHYGDLPAEIETKYILLILFGMGALAAWSGSEAVLPAYIIGMVLAGLLGKHHAFVRRIRTLTLGLLTPFYFIRAGSFVSISALVAAPFVFIVLLAAKMVSKIIGVYPASILAKYPRLESIYTTLLMSTGLTFGTISALFGLTHGIISEEQYSYLVATVIGSAVIPTVIANAFYLPRHLLHENPSHPTGDSKEKVINAYDNVIANGEKKNNHHLLDAKASHIDAQVHQIDKSLVFSQNKVNVSDRES